MTMHDVAALALLVLSVIALVQATFLFVQLVAALRSPDPAESPNAVAARSTNLAVLMPAHNEASGVEASIRAILPQLGPNDRLVVVADNCNDATASVARAAGAEVVERNDAERRGKGYALDFGVRELERDPPEMVVIVDADCIVAPQGLGRLALKCLATAQPVQALYLMRASSGASLGMRIAEFAWVVKNKVRPLGSATLGWPCQLMGTGMAFPWSVIQHAPLASGHLVEDMRLGLDLASGGHAPVFCPQALVSSVFPVDIEGAKSQRTRWEHGHLSVIASLGPRLLWRALARRDASLLALTLDLLVPPLAAFMLVLGALLLIGAAWWRLAGDGWPLTVSIFAMALFAVGVISAWVRHGRHIVTLGELLTVPWFIAAKIPIYVRLFTKRQVEWVRTKRDERGH